ncbi:MAG: hypothetical protein OXE85_08045 [Roseovarius sp.]|nr:hypothetical protein [Roseovarius sp.]
MSTNNAFSHQIFHVEPMKKARVLVMPRGKPHLSVQSEDKKTTDRFKLAILNAYVRIKIET